MASFWPLFDLELHTARLVLRPARDDDFPALLDAIDAGIHDREMMPFSFPWTDAEPARRRVNSVKYWWAQRARWNAEDWNIDFAVSFEGITIGVQGLFAQQFPVLREVASGSWLSLPYQERGFGKEMRTAVLHLAFDGLGALVARSGAFVDNPASMGVSKAMGYRENGRFRHAPRGDPKEMVNFEITREEWTRRYIGLPPVTVVGLDAALPMFGLPEEEQAVRASNDPNVGRE
jgi:RimJ/RimL family protein N-acetyltransferase